MSRVYGLVVIYNTSVDEIKSVVDSIRKQCHKIIVCNNSDNGFIYNDNFNTKVFNFGENLGIAKAQSIGMKWAINDGADFILQMDQDSILLDGVVQSLVNSYESLVHKGVKVGIIGPSFFDKVTSEKNKAKFHKGHLIDGTNIEIVLNTISSSSLISREAIVQCGYMEDELFIDWVDWEYCWRLRSHGFLTVKDLNVEIGHRVGEGIKKVWGVIPILVPSPIRHYYHTRNFILLFKRDYVPKSVKIIGIIKLLFKLTTYPILLDKGVLRWKLIVKGLIDGLLSKTGKIN